MTELGHSARRALGLMSALVVTACGEGSGDPTSPGGTEKLMPTLSSIQTHVFDPSCAGHHGVSATAAGLDLSAGRSFESLVNVLSTQVGLSRVTPGDADNSYLVHKIEGRPGITGRQMPIDGPPLDADQIAAIRQWIDAGARYN